MLNVSEVEVAVVELDRGAVCLGLSATGSNPSRPILADEWTKDRITHTHTNPYAEYFYFRLEFARFVTEYFTKSMFFFIDLNYAL